MAAISGKPGRKICAGRQMLMWRTQRFAQPQLYWPQVVIQKGRPGAPVRFRRTWWRTATRTGAGSGVNGAARRSDALLPTVRGRSGPPAEPRPPPCSSRGHGGRGRKRCLQHHCQASAPSSGAVSHLLQRFPTRQTLVALDASACRRRPAEAETKDAAGCASTVSDQSGLPGKTAHHINRCWAR
jgi:hypothetical protein